MTNSNNTSVLFSSSNFTNMTDNSLLRSDGGAFEPTAVKSLRLFGYAVLFIFGVFGNLMVIVAVRKPRMKIVTNVLIANLGLADLLVALFNIPSVVTYAHLWQWPFGEALCKVLPFLQGLTLCASVGTLLAIACDRYWHIVHFKRRKLKLKEAYQMIGLIWASSVAVPMPLLFFCKIITVPQGNSDVVRCEEIWPSVSSRKVYTMIVFLVLYLCPLVVISWLYVVIVLWLRSLPTMASSLRVSKQRAQKRVILMLVTVVVLFALCWLPYHVIFIYMDYSTPAPSDYEVIVSAILFAQWLVFASSACNPVVYAVMNENYRREFVKMLAFCKCKKRTSPGDTSDRGKSGSMISSSVLYITSV